MTVCIYHIVAGELAHLLHGSVDKTIGASKCHVNSSRREVHLGIEGGTVALLGICFEVIFNLVIIYIYYARKNRALKDRGG